jgi:Tfp pilus assembly protein PilW
MSRQRGASLVEALVAAAIGLLVLSALTAALAGGARALVRSGARAEASDTSGLAAEAFLFDVRRAGHDPAATGVMPLVLARADRLTLEADLDGDGTVDGASAEHVSWVCNATARRLSRVVGTQSMPLADGVLGCGFRYLDPGATDLAPPASGLDATNRSRVALLVFDLRLVPRGGGPFVERSLAVALRGRS